MADENKLIPFILKREGGLANHPNYKGGATNKGITISSIHREGGNSLTTQKKCEDE